MQTVPSAPRQSWSSALLGRGIILASLGAPALAMAADATPEDVLPRLGMSPGEPQVRSATPAIPFGIQPATSKEYVLDFHGYLLLPARLAMHERDMPLPGQSSTVLHSPPLIAQDLRDFQYTGVVPAPWLQLNFIYGNSTVSATAILAGTSANDAAGFYNPVEQFGVNDAYLTLNLTKKLGFPIQVHVGAFTGRYGAMGSYDAGRYGTPLIARTNTIGETITAGYKVGDVMLLLEQGLGGQLGRPPIGLVPAGWNDFANPNVGATFVNHAHLGAAYGSLGRIGFHYLTAWTQDDLAPGGQVPDGRITVLGADVSVNAGAAGHLYLGAAKTWATNASTVSGAIEILNARGGPELMEHYLGPNSGGNGTLTTFGLQYDLSVSKLVFGKLYTGISPDVLISVFGVGTSVTSNDAAYDGVFKLKGGVEATYLFLSWLGVSERFDHVRQDNSDSKTAMSIISTRVLFHTGWKSRDEIALQYSHFIYGSDVLVKTGYPPVLDPNVNPDRDVFSLTGTFWW
jgi:hypothetical protein